MKFAFEFMLIFPLYPIMFGERGGVSAAGVGLLLGAGSVLTVFFEVPTGVIADKISRKYVMMLAIIARMFCMLAWLAWPSFWGYMAGTLFLSLGAALESGALQAYLYGTLGADGKQSFGKFWSRVSAMTMLAWSTAYIAAALIGVHYGLLLAMCALACLVAVLICLGLPKDDIAASHMEVKPKILRSATSHIIHSKQLRSLLLSGVLVVGLAWVTVEYIGPYYHNSGVDTRWVPVLMAAGNVLGATMFWTLHSWEWFLDKYKLWLALAVIVLFALSSMGGAAALCVGFLLMARFLRILQVQFEAHVQHLSNDEARATISSLVSFASNLVAGALMFAVGLLAVGEKILLPLQIVLLAGAVLFVFLYLLNRRSASSRLQQT